MATVTFEVQLLVQVWHMKHGDALRVPRQLPLEEGLCRPRNLRMHKLKTYVKKNVGAIVVRFVWKNAVRRLLIWMELLENSHRSMSVPLHEITDLNPRRLSTVMYILAI
jgi:hypothetical protein